MRWFRRPELKPNTLYLVVRYETSDPVAAAQWRLARRRTEGKAISTYDPDLEKLVAGYDPTHQPGRRYMEEITMLLGEYDKHLPILQWIGAPLPYADDLLRYDPLEEANREYATMLRELREWEELYKKPLRDMGELETMEYSFGGNPILENLRRYARLLYDLYDANREA